MLPCICVAVPGCAFCGTRGSQLGPGAEIAWLVACLALLAIRCAVVFCGWGACQHCGAAVVRRHSTYCDSRQHAHYCVCHACLGVGWGLWASELTVCSWHHLACGLTSASLGVLFRHASGLCLGSTWISMGAATRSPAPLFGLGLPALWFRYWGCL